MSEDDDFAMSTFELGDQLLERRKQQHAEVEEPWCIVMHSKVAVRAAPTTDGKPFCVLPQGSVIRADRVQRVDGVRWLVLHADDLTLLTKKCIGGGGQIPPGIGTCMMIESTAAGQLLMVAPKEFPWHELSHMPPCDRGEAARTRVLQTPGDCRAASSSCTAAEAYPDWTDTQIKKLLEKHDAMASQNARQHTATVSSSAMATYIQPNYGSMMDIDDTVERPR